MIDTGRIDPSEPIDLTTICNTKLYKLDPHDREFGVQLTDEVSLYDYFQKLFVIEKIKSQSDSTQLSEHLFIARCLTKFVPEN